VLDVPGEFHERRGFLAAEGCKAIHPKLGAAKPFALRDMAASFTQVLRRIEQLFAQKFQVGHVKNLQVVKFGCRPGVARCSGIG
jgi:hypothetical protein